MGFLALGLGLVKSLAWARAVTLGTIVSGAERDLLVHCLSSDAPLPRPLLRESPSPGALGTLSCVPPRSVAGVQVSMGIGRLSCACLFLP